MASHAAFVNLGSRKREPGRGIWVEWRGMGRSGNRCRINSLGKKVEFLSYL